MDERALKYNNNIRIFGIMSEKIERVIKLASAQSFFIFFFEINVNLFEFWQIELNFGKFTVNLSRINFSIHHKVWLVKNVSDRLPIPFLVREVDRLMNDAKTHDDDQQNQQK